MANNILVIAEQREQKLVRVSIETIAAAQQIAAHTGAQVEVAILGDSIEAAAQELATRAREAAAAAESRISALEARIAALETPLPPDETKI